MLLRRVNGPGNGGRIVQAGIVANANGGGANIHSTNDNGNVRVLAAEGGRRVIITHRQEENIVVCVTESTPAGDKTTVYPAKNLGDLKAKYPDAHQMFERLLRRDPPRHSRRSGIARPRFEKLIPKSESANPRSPARCHSCRD